MSPLPQSLDQVTPHEGFAIVAPNRGHLFLIQAGLIYFDSLILMLFEILYLAAKF